MNKILFSLDGTWSLCLIPNEDVTKNQLDIRTREQLDGCGYESISADVPGNFELDLVRAGLAPDPYYSQNAWDFQQYENRHLYYSVDFNCDVDADKNTFILFEGIDTVCDIYINGKFLGRTENMLISHEFCVDGFIVKGKNQILLHIHPSTIYARKYELKPMNRGQRYNMSSIPLRKAPYMYGWDIMPRFVSGGIWKSVKIIQKPEERIEQVYLYTTSLDTEKNIARYGAFFEIHTDKDDLSELTVTVDAVCGDSHFGFEERLWHTYENLYKIVENPKLWYPKHAGEQNIYKVTVKLLRNGETCDTRCFDFGIRTVELDRTSVTDADGNGEFVFKVNGKRIFCMGTNWCPTDAFPSRHKQYLRRGLDMIEDLNCNIVRCWGGNVYEDDEFYRYCDTHGILVWQDFSLACATYLQGDDFAEKVYREAVSVIKRLREHPSLLLWAGDNEVDCAYKIGGFRRDPNYNRISRDILAAAVREYDVVRPYLPSSPYIDKIAFESGKPTSEEHLWGARGYFKGDFYKNNTCHFASEIGYHGCPSPESLAKFIAKDKLWPIFDENGNPNDDWICHSSEMQKGMKGPYSYFIGLMAQQVKTLFGNVGDNLSDFARQSQISNAEAKKYFIESFRISKWRRTGIIWWNLIDGWPQITNAVVDWYGCKKLAYNYIKRSQASVCMMMDEKDANGENGLYAVNDLQLNKRLKYRITDITHGTLLSEGECEAPADSSVRVCGLALPENSFIYIEWSDGDGVSGENHYTTTTLNISYSQYIEDIKKVGFYQFEGFDS